MMTRKLPALEVDKAGLGRVLARRGIEFAALELIQNAFDEAGVSSVFVRLDRAGRGKHTLKVCHGTACHVNGAEGLDLALKTELGVDAGETTDDGEFSVEKVACLGCCSLAPVVMLDQEVHGRLTGDKLKKVVRKVGT